MQDLYLNITAPKSFRW